MSGHSKWANTKHRKILQDTKRSKIFTKIIRELVAATSLGGTDVSLNPRLRSVIDKALSNNMTRDTINRVILRGAGSNKNNHLKTITYEGYGPGGTAIMVECLSDNRNRTVSNIRNAFIKYGGNLGINGSVTYLFMKYGVISYEVGINKNNLIEAILNVGVEDIKFYNNDIVDVYTTIENFNNVKDALDSIGFKALNTKVIIIPSRKVNLNTHTAHKLLRLIDIIKNYEDVQEVYHNGEI